MIADILILGGAVLILLSAVGVTRFTDVLARMHALTKASTIGVALVLVGGAVGLDDVGSKTYVLLTAMLQLMATPVSANLISRATYKAEMIPHRVDTVDELARARARSDQDEAGLDPGSNLPEG